MQCVSYICTEFHRDLEPSLLGRTGALALGGVAVGWTAAGLALGGGGGGGAVIAASMPGATLEKNHGKSKCQSFFLNTLASLRVREC